MEIIGLLLIIIWIIPTTWWVCTDHPYKPWAITILGFVVFIGIFLMVRDRAIEITVENIGTIKAAAKQATDDAEAVAELRKRIEAQSATVDLVAQSATNAHNLIENLLQKNLEAEAKIKELNLAGDTIQKIVTELKETSEFMFLVTAAQNDDRKAFEKLSEWGDKQESIYQQYALSAIIRIRGEFNRPFMSHGFYPLKLLKGTDLSRLTFVGIMQRYKHSNRSYKPGLVDMIQKTNMINKKEKMAFYSNILRNDDSLLATFLAGEFFIKAAGDKNLKWEPFTTKPLLDWWAVNHNSIDN